ncbi:MAG: glycosyltransferase family 4 protein [Desulfovibrionaceae bacterium]|jgi:glycosyltransferase involved in cell wall biosynthesis|nr:glycosyltransferase family 4 protein [Desulfovibrionaceae bacterium]
MASEHHPPDRPGSEKRVRVLHVAKGFGPGGTEKVLQLFAAHLDRARFEVAAWGAADGERAPMLRAVSVPTFVGGDLLSVLLRFAPDVVHVHRGGWPEPALIRPVKLARATRAAGRPAGPPKGLPALVETNVFGRHDPTPLAACIDRHLYVSDFCRARLAAAGRIAPDDPRHGVLHNPVDTDFLAPFGAGRDFSKPVVGRLSRPDPGKWSDLALDFVPELARRVPGLVYRVVGGTDAARARVAELGVEDVVEFVDPLVGERALGEFLASISVLAHANDTGESFGLAIAEAMAAGLPVVTHPCPPPRDNAQLELVEHGVTGLVARDAGDYAAALARLLLDPAEARRMGAAGQAKAQREYRVQAVVRRLESIYDAVLAERARA